MQITPATPVAEIAATWPGTVKVFQAHGLPFCCSGGLPLADACADAGIGYAALVAELQTAGIRAGHEHTDWTVAPLDQLVRFIVDVYHAPLRVDLPRLVEMAHKVALVRGTQAPDLIPALVRCVEELHAHVLEHLDEEEAELFPAVLDVWARHAGLAPAAPARHTRSLDDLALHLEDDHRSIGRLLKQMASLTSWYVPPPDACNTMRGLYFELSQLTEHTYVHVHLENNVLIPRARTLAGAVLSLTEEV
jgi:regulator of cell morphogenesis and NO signaling